MKRIAVLGISYEALLRSPVPTETMEIQRGRNMLGAGLWLVRGIEQRLNEESDVEIVPILWATALPGGGFTAEIYQQVKAECLQGLRNAGPLDGVVLANHGAMEVHGLSCHADTDFAMAVREAVGPQAIITVALDLHGHITQQMLAVVDAISALRTAPHRDDQETGYRAAHQLIQILQSGRRPKIAAVRIPMLIPGEQSVTTTSPGKELYARLPEINALPGIMDANILVGFAWNDRPWVGMTAYVTAQGDLALATRQAQQLAEDIWARRRDFILRMETAGVVEGLRRAAEARERPLFLSDSGDNTTAGAYGDLTTVLQAVLAEPALTDVVVAGITAPGIVQQCRQAGIGAIVQLTLGAEHRSAPKTARQVSAVVEAVDDELRPDGFQPYLRESAAWARVRIDHVLVTFHAASIGITTPAHFTMMGIDPLAHQAYVVKLGYLHPQLEDISARHILLMSDGAANLDVCRLPFSQVPRPVWPLDPEGQWSAAANTYTTPD
ncbi:MULTISPECIES: M81 family metallopeptidase [unclassified Brenneria]|uniref:M81 family metallopeptidase n=1 Tax=unclassified Brenneria TaxID=2634434 RepID=UPI00155478D7|nr:M81 family metallopeptidase [Brenneria sp. hezel4-2-4]MEE3651916.1 M81 family metallopeptidase [Brenneria sp. HEZEL_4_2_4]NPD01876.1 M81 family metallopeptidase [Brenneria sp. hezel4-2-4]